MTEHNLPKPLKKKSRSFPPVFGNINISMYTYICIGSGMKHMYMHIYIFFYQ